MIDILTRRGREVKCSKARFPPSPWVSSEAIISTRGVFGWICGDLARSEQDLRNSLTRGSHRVLSLTRGQFGRVLKGCWRKKNSRPLLEESCAGSTASAAQARAAAPAQRAHEAAARASCAILHHQPLSSRRLLLVMLCARQKAAAPFCM